MKTIGLIGGLSWESSAEYYRLLNQAVRNRRGGLHAANIVMHSLDFAPIAAFLLGVTNVTVPWETLLLSTVLYVVLPLLAGMTTRQLLVKRSPTALGQFVASLKPWKASPVRIRIPRSAASPAPRTIESGAEMPSAQG